MAIDKVDLITANSNQAGQLIKAESLIVDNNNSLRVQCREAVVNKVNEQAHPCDRVTFQVISNTKAQEYVKMMEGFKQDSIKKLRTLDMYMPTSIPARRGRVSVSRRSVRNISTPSMSEYSTDWHVPLMGHISALHTAGEKRRKLKSARPRPP